MKTVETIRSLRGARFEQDQAEAIAQAIENSGLESLTKEVTNQGRDIAVLKWMVGFNMAMTLAILWKVFS